jgi:hypothetical protein
MAKPRYTPIELRPPVMEMDGELSVIESEKADVLLKLSSSNKFRLLVESSSEVLLIDEDAEDEPFPSQLANKPTATADPIIQLMIALRISHQCGEIFR